MPKTRPLLIVVALIVALAPAARAQAVSGAIRGRVVDERGRPLAGVLVRLVNLRSGFRYAALTDVAGVYRVDFLIPSLYDITAEKAGYESGRIDAFQAEVASTKEIIPPPITLRPTAGGATGAVAASARDQVDTATSEIQFHVPDADLVALPLAGLRALDDVALLVPGVARPPETVGLRGPGVGPGVGTAGSFSVHGLRARSNTFTWDGADDNDQDVGVRRQGFLLPAPAASGAVAEFEITTLLPAPSSGRTSGATVNVVTRTGSNRTGGEAYAFGTGGSLAARDPFDVAGPGNPGKDPFGRLQVGARGQAPLVSSRAVVFASFERARLVEVRDLHFAVPTPEERDAAFREVGRRTRLGRDLLSPEFLPLPNDPGGVRGAETLTRALDASGSGWAGVVRLDAQLPAFGREATASLRASASDDRARIPAVDDAVSSELESSSATTGVASFFRFEAGARTSVEARLSWSRTSVGFAEVAGSPLVFASPERRSGPVGRVRFDPYSPVGVDPSSFAQDRLGETTALGVLADRDAGAHEVRFGADLRLVRFAGRLDRNYRAEVAFTSGYVYDLFRPERSSSGLAFAAAGVPSSLFQTLALDPDSYVDLRSRETALFVEDQWKPRPNLLVTTGLRYDYAAPPRSHDGSLERRLALTERDVPGLDESDPVEREFAQTFRALVAQIGGRARIYDPDRDNVGPRVGVVWDPSRRGTFSVRGGYALVYDVPLGTVVTQSRNTFPAYVPVNFGSTTLFPELLARNPALLPGPVLVPGSLNRLNGTLETLPEVLGGLFFVERGALAYTLPERRLRTPYAHEWSVGVETLAPARSRVSARYVGTRGRSLTRLALPNGGPFTSARYVPSREALLPLFDQDDRPDLRLGPYEEFRSDASSAYDALELSWAGEPATGLRARAGYTWSHAIDDVSDVFATAGSSAFAEDELGRAGGRAAERASAAFDVRHRFTADFVYRLPWGEGRAWGGLGLAGVAELASGQPYTIVTSLDANLDGVLTDRLDTTNGLVRFDDGPRLVGLAAGVDAESLVAPLDAARPRTGALGRNTFRGRGRATLDLALSKTFVVGRARGEFRLEAFNALNRVNYALPLRVLETPGFGTSVATSTRARVLQIGVRVGF